MQQIAECGNILFLIGHYCWESENHGYITGKVYPDPSSAWDSELISRKRRLESRCRGQFLLECSLRTKKKTKV